MPGRPANIGGQESLHVINQSVREINIRLDSALKQIPVHKLQKNASTFTFGPILAGAIAESSVSVPGVTQSSTVHVSPQLNIGSLAFMWSAYVSSPGQVTIRIHNTSGGTLTPNTMKWNIGIIT
jgi:hypothetical protein